MTEQLYSEDTPDPKKPLQKSNSKDATLLDRLKETVTKKIERPVVRLAVPERPGVSLRISPNITQQQMRAWRRNSGEDSKAGMDATKLAAYVVGNTTIGILFNDEEVYDDDGHGLNCASRVVLEMTSAARPVPDAVIALFGIQPHVEAAALSILDAAGFSDNVNTEDPTKESQTTSQTTPILYLLLDWQNCGT